MNTNDIVNGKVSHVAKSYALIEIESAGKIGLLHVTEMRGGSRGARSARLAALQPGWDVTVEVLKIEGESGKERISLSERSIQDRCVQEELQPGQEVTGKVADVREYGAIVELETPCVSTGLKALLHASQLPGPGRRERDEYLKRFKAGDAITAEVVSIEQRDGELRIGLSLVAAEQRKLKAELTGEGVGNAPVYKGTVTRRGQGGFTVEFGSRDNPMSGFLPDSELGRTSSNSIKVGGCVRVRVAEINGSQVRLTRNGIS